MANFPIYSPLICPPGWEPDFTAGPEGCTLLSGNVSRSRLVAGGSLFRSVDTAATDDVNGIVLQLIVGVGAGSPIRTYPLELIISGTMVGSPPIIIASSQSWNTVNVECSSSGVVNLRAAVLVEDTIITMPPSDTATWTDVECLMSSFGPTNMAGGVGIPTYSSGIRTGPTYALFHVAEADTAENGTLETVNTISEWDGVNNQWIAHPSTLYEVGGSPLPCP